MAYRYTVPKAARDEGNRNLTIPVPVGHRKSGDLYPLGGVMSKA